MIEKLNIKIKPDPSRVLLRELVLNNRRTERIFNDIVKKEDEEVSELLAKVFADFSDRHRNLEDRLFKNYRSVQERIKYDSVLSKDKQLVIGTLFSMEYTTEAAALFNPSIVKHPVQDTVGKIKFILSLRSTGEGHISSISFREGYINQDGSLELLSASNFVTPPDNYKTDITEDRSDYDVFFDESTSVSERTLFPWAESEQGGMEDVRFVEFRDEEKTTFYGTYTAYDRKKIRTQLIITEDFREFKIRKLFGEASVDKGMALFPRKIEGKYWMISRQDQENLFVIDSEDVLVWNNPERIRVPQYNWELVQLGNCGSPIELDEGWLVITHAVGPMRKYVLGAILLEKKDPRKIIGSLPKPLIEAEGTERNGYVPNVVYSCGSMRNGNNIYIPYAVSDTYCSFAIGDINKILKAMR